MEIKAKEIELETLEQEHSSYLKHEREKLQSIVTRLQELLHINDDDNKSINNAG